MLLCCIRKVTLLHSITSPSCENPHEQNFVTNFSSLWIQKKRLAGSGRDCPDSYRGQEFVSGVKIKGNCSCSGPSLERQQWGKLHLVRQKGSERRYQLGAHPSGLTGREGLNVWGDQSAIIHAAFPSFPALGSSETSGIEAPRICFLVHFHCGFDTEIK